MMQAQKKLRSVSLSNFNRVKVLGIGSFGRVELVQERSDPTQMYALKIQQKSHIIELKQLDNCMNERKLLERVGIHPFICTLHATYADKDLLYMLLECVKGGELFQLLRNFSHHTTTRRELEHLPIHSCRFYTGCVVDALGYLHKQRIIYRDLKPENLLIDTDGYLKIVDLGFAKRLQRKNVYRTYTICGTPDYMAPEMLKNLGYDITVDVWAVGVLIFEMICGYAPFSGDGGGGSGGGEKGNGGGGSGSGGDSGRHNAAQTMRNIMKRHVLIPQWLQKKDSETVRIIRSLLVKNPINRLGCSSQGNILKLFRHPWFRNLNSVDLHERRIKSPWRPNLGGTSVVEPSVQYEWDFQIEPYEGPQDCFEGW